MWVIINKTYTGPLGIFPGGRKYDLPEKTIAGIRESLGKENVIDTCAPWEEHVDKKAVTAAELKDKANTAIKSVEAKKVEMIEHRKVAAQINTLKKEIEDGTEKAKKLAKAAGIDWPAKS